MYTVEELVDFIKDLSGRDEVKPDSDIFLDVRMIGDDFHEMISKYAKKYSVEMKNYLWYFHADEEGGRMSFGGEFFKPPYERVKRIPISPLMLTDFANKGKWNIEYPEHKLPKRRYDILINQILVGVLLACLLFWLVKKYVA